MDDISKKIIDDIKEIIELHEDMIVSDDEKIRELFMTGMYDTDDGKEQLDYLRYSKCHHQERVWASKFIIKRIEKIIKEG